MSQDILDNIDKIKQLDRQNMLGSLEFLGKQIEQIWNTAKKVKIPKIYAKVSNIVVLGMGGSAYGGRVLKSLFQGDLSVPLEIVNNYKVPRYVNEGTLVVASSYSGTTEEIISAAQEAYKQKAKVMVISSGNILAAWAKKNKLPALIFATSHNPCGSPRMGLGYTIFGLIALLANLGILKLTTIDIKDVLGVVFKYGLEFGVKNLGNKNLAKQLAGRIFSRSVWYVASEHLAANAHVASYQLNENGKRFGGYFLIPELNHHLMEGMLYPPSNKNDIMFVFFESGLYDQRLQKRYAITKQVLEKNGIAYVSYKLRERTSLLQVCEALVLSGYLSYYSAILEGINPTPIPFVDFFKEQMGK